MEAKLTDKDRARLKKLIKRERCGSISKMLSKKGYLKECYLDKQKKFSPLHIAAKKGKTASLSCLIREGCKTRIQDRKGNLPIHLALMFALKTGQHENTCEELNEELVLPLIKAAPEVMDVQNNAGISPRDLLLVFDQLLLEEQSHRKKKQNHRRCPAAEVGVGSILLGNDDWKERLAEEAEEEYAASWGKFENDFDWIDPGGPETYDEWVERILRERARKRQPPSPPPPQPKKSKWTEDDQKKFREEETRKSNERKGKSESRSRCKIYSKLQEGKVEFLMDFSSEDLGRLILSELSSLKGDEKLKAFKELRRFWHPDKFIQKFGCSLTDEKKPLVMRLITEVSQRINTFSV